MRATLTKAMVLAATFTLVGCGGGSASPAGSRYAGRKLEQSLQAGWNQYKFQSEPIMARQLAAALRNEPMLTQVGAIEAAFGYAQALTFQQRLQPGDENRLIDAMEREFPATKQTLNNEVAHS